ncbi:MAG TPA: SMP-30/gluconolactonase/LRE family protein [Vicinamibacterales bacterium]
MTRVLVAVFVVATVTAVLAQTSVQNGVVRLDPALDAVIPAHAKAELLKGDYFGATEGPVWVDAAGGYLLFSDMAANVIYKWTPKGQLSVFLEKSGYTGNDVNNVGGQYTNGRLHLLNIGSNGLTLDRDGRLIIAGMTDRNVTRLEKDGTRTTLADTYDGNRLNSPNDIVVKSDGAVYFTETTSGMRGRDESPARELPFHGVYVIKDSTLRLLDKDPQGTAPNGIAFSPDEKILYVNGGLKINAYDVLADDTIANARVLIDMSAEKPPPGNTDGMKVDQRGNIYCSGPGGTWIVSPEGKHLGTIVTPERVANLAFGDADSRTLYMVGGRSLWRIRTNIAGIRPMTKETR